MIANKVVVVDIDGTIANQDHRSWHLKIEPKNWDAYFAACDRDTPIKNVCQIVRDLAKQNAIYYCTGRRDTEYQKTLKWLNDNEMPFGELLMRKNGDKRHDILVKPELLRNSGVPFEDVLCVLEDRNSMVAKWRELGLTVMHVAEGDF